MQVEVVEEFECLDWGISQDCLFNVESNRWVIKASHLFPQSLQCSMVQEVAEDGDQAVAVQGCGLGYPIKWQRDLKPVCPHFMLLKVFVVGVVVTLWVSPWDKNRNGELQPLRFW